MSTDHHIILAELKEDGVRRNRRYYKGRYIWSIVAPKGDPMEEGDSKIEDLQKGVRKPTLTAHEKATWISAATLKLVDQRTAMRWIQTEVQLEIREAKRILRKHYRRTGEGG